MIQPRDIGALNPEDLISGHNGEKQQLTIRRTQTVADPRRRVQMVERVADDQWGNVYLVYSAQLSDRELWEVADWVKPGIIERYGGFTDALLDDYRTKAFRAFADAEQSIARVRTETNAVVAQVMRDAQRQNLGGN